MWQQEGTLKIIWYYPFLLPFIRELGFGIASEGKNVPGRDSNRCLDVEAKKIGDGPVGEKCQVGKYMERAGGVGEASCVGDCNRRLQVALPGQKM
jgi:hypothetical protein